MFLRAALAIAIFTLSLAAAKKPITLDVVAQNRPRDGVTPVWAPDGKRFAFERDKKIYLYDVPTKKESELISLDRLADAAAKPPTASQFDWRNRRVREDSFQWSSSGREILLPVEGDLFLWRLDSGKWEQLTHTPDIEADPQLSPDGASVAFRRGSDLYVLHLADHKETRLTDDGSPALLNGELDWVYPEELALGAAYWWSPDSQRIAYLQFDIGHEFTYPQTDLKGLRAALEMERYPQAGTPNADVRLGVVAARGGPTKWIDLGETRGHLIARVDWTPDSKSLAVQRMNRVQSELDLLTADPETGSHRLLLHEADRYWINISDEYRFLKTGEFLWSSERDGFRQLYLYSSAGKEQIQVTSGQSEVSQIAGIDEGKRRIYYVSGDPSPLERQLFAINLDGTGKTRLTQEAGTHSISMGPAAEYYLDSWSNLTHPARRTLHSIDGAEWAVYREADRKLLDEYEILPTEIVTIQASDGTPLYGRLIKPANYREGQKYPLIVMVYGGPGAQSIHDAWAGATWDQALAQRGYAIWQLDNRGGAGRGHAFESVLYRRFGKTELEDQKTGIEYLIKRGFVDPARIGIYGWSYGGYMTLYSLFNAPDLFRAGVAGAPVTNWRNYDTIYTERYLGVPEENQEGYLASSAATYAQNLKARLLIVHNIEDDNVLFQNTIQVADALEKADKPFSMEIYTQKSHGVSGPERKHLLEATTRFFDENLK